MVKQLTSTQSSAMVAGTSIVLILCTNGMAVSADDYWDKKFFHFKNTYLGQRSSSSLQTTDAGRSRFKFRSLFINEETRLGVGLGRRVLCLSPGAPQQT